MKTVVIGKKEDIKYGFRETCFGLFVSNEKLLLVKKDGQYSLIGGGIENGENKEECLRREFLEEAGLEITKTTEFVTIDCYWLAGGKYPLRSLANIYIVDVCLSSIQKPLEDGNELEYVNINDAIDLLPLPYHKKSVELFVENQKK
ncbi:MAG: NUDIX domain-containing protein [Clostridiales bacterium]|nr:NUDIX domain-containing protein [Clostridiales bacterium]